MTRKVSSTSSRLARLSVSMSIKVFEIALGDEHRIEDAGE